MVTNLVKAVMKKQTYNAKSMGTVAELYSLSMCKKHQKKPTTPNNNKKENNTVTEDLQQLPPEQASFCLLCLGSYVLNNLS